MAAKKDITIYRGDTYINEVNLRTSNNSAINISAMSFSGAMKTSGLANSNTAVFDIEKTDAANGVFTFTLSAANSANIRPGTYVYDLQQINGSIVTTLMAGKVIIRGDIT